MRNCPHYKINKDTNQAEMIGLCNLQYFSKAWVPQNNTMEEWVREKRYILSYSMLYLSLASVPIPEEYTCTSQFKLGYFQKICTCIHTQIKNSLGNTLCPTNNRHKEIPVKKYDASVTEREVLYSIRNISMSFPAWGNSTMLSSSASSKITQWKRES